MPEIRNLPPLPRPIQVTDHVLIETPTGSFRAPGTAFKGEQGSPALRHSAACHSDNGLNPDWRERHRFGGPRKSL